MPYCRLIWHSVAATRGQGYWKSANRILGRDQETWTQNWCMATIPCSPKVAYSLSPIIHYIRKAHYYHNTTSIPPMTAPSPKPKPPKSETGNLPSSSATISRRGSWAPWDTTASPVLSTLTSHHLPTHYRIVTYTATHSRRTLTHPHSPYLTHSQAPSPAFPTSQQGAALIHPSPSPSVALTQKEEPVFS